MTETTNITVNKAKPTLFYDGTCGMCTTWIMRLAPLLAKRDVKVGPFPNGAEEPEMILQRDNKKYGGANAIIALLKIFPITCLLGLLLNLPPLRNLLHLGYRYVANNRHCNSNGCKIPTGKTSKGWLALAIPLLIAFVIGVAAKLEGWIWMWLLAAANWFGFKWMCFKKAGSWSQIEPIYFLWPGMDTAGFRYKNRPDTKTINLKAAAGFVLAGIGFGIAIIFTEAAYLRGWMGILAMLCLLHFGTFPILATILNRRGFAADPIMRQPWKASGLGDFWSNRWNRAFSDWTRTFLFYPLTRKLGIYYGTLAGFFASGIAHEIAISVPARAGYGLPTLYFMIQGMGLLIAKQFHFRRRGLDRIWMWALVLAPAPLLFHPPFFNHVFNPMTELITQLFN